MDSRAHLERVLTSKDLSTEERLVLQGLIDLGYSRDGCPYGRAGAIPAEELAALLPVIPNEEDDGVIVEYEEGSTKRKKRVRRQRSEQGIMRVLRVVINRLVIRHGLPIMCEAGPGGGYYLPASAEEVEQNHHRFHQRAMTGLMKASRARKGAYADAVTQLTLGFDGPEGDTFRERLGLAPRRIGSPPAWVAVITNLLDRVKGDPQQYADQIREIQERYGDIFIPRYKVTQLREELGKVQRMLGELA